ncbi:hypothetical protein [Kocuria sp.]|uniref:hypothetical protein n=1 Tax=Kocuria sp. TaxID=1871328 RepID=UPI0026DEAF72|nr:hypothetical protein [Kocuria sp.]MDO5619751.1 hypothetical protein [Kocuria sp.]
MKDPLGKIRAGIELPSYLPSLHYARLRTTWMATILTQDVRISEFMAMAGTVSAKTLEAIAPYVPGRWDADVYLMKAANLC